MTAGETRQRQKRLKMLLRELRREGGGFPRRTKRGVEAVGEFSQSPVMMKMSRNRLQAVGITSFRTTIEGGGRLRCQHVHGTEERTRARLCSMRHLFMIKSRQTLF